jgi:uncharacterized protein YcgL (UPF0745 family)
MQCFIYKSLRKVELYLYVNKRDDFSLVPKELLEKLGKLEFVMELELNPERKLAREDVDKVMKSLDKTGFFVQMPPSFFSEPSVTSNRQLH